ncbi:hypothetical protein KIPB_016568, partial [Kipferlia bialata]|eukprot:g16568.t1
MAVPCVNLLTQLSDEGPSSQSSQEASQDGAAAAPVEPFAKRPCE